MELYEHQENGVAMLAEHDCFGLFWDMGTCKTLTMLIHLSNLALAGSVEKVLWIAPKSALGAVERDFEKMREVGWGYRVDSLEPLMLCINYEKVSRKTSKIRAELDFTEWDAIVLDEAHCVAAPGSNRTKYLIGTRGKPGLVAKAKYRYFMTGTPVTNSRYQDFWSFLYTMNKGVYHPYSSFEREYLKVRQIPGKHFTIVTGGKNKEELLNQVASFSHSVQKEECLDLPEIMPDEVIYVPLSTSINEEFSNRSSVTLYKEAEENVIEDLEEVIRNALVRTLRLRQIAAGHIKDGQDYYVLKNNKVDYAIEWVNSTRRKVVIFYEFESTFRELTNALKKSRIPYVFLNGAQPNKNIWRDFQDADPSKCRVFVAQYKSANAGIDLYTASDTLYMEPCNSSTVLDQSRSRTHRNGQSRACTFTFLITKGTIEEEMYKSLQAHEDFNDILWLTLKRKEYLEKRTRKGE